MHIKDILAPANAISLARSFDKNKLLRELSTRAANELRLDPARVVSEIARREELGSTGVGAGIAIPHARIAGVSKAFGLLARLERGIDFAAVDGNPVDIVFLLLLPPTSSGEQLTALACVTRALRDSNLVAAIRAAGSSAAIYSAVAS